MEEAIDLMKVELQNMSTSEQGLVSKVRYIDSQNQELPEESSSLNKKAFLQGQIQAIGNSANSSRR